MKQTFWAAGVMAAMAIAVVPAAAQAPATGPTWYVAGEGGMQAVQHVGGLGGLQLGLHVTPRLDIFGEGLYLQDVVTRRRTESAAQLAAYLAQSQGKAASSTLTMPAGVIGGGVRYFINSSKGLRPYVQGQGGMARMTLRPGFVLGGADVTASLAQYGVTLGSDLTGTLTKPVFGGGFGIVTNRGPWAIDLGIRVLSIQIDGQAANVKTLSASIGRTF